MITIKKDEIFSMEVSEKSEKGCINFDFVTYSEGFSIPELPIGNNDIVHKDKNEFEGFKETVLRIEFSRPEVIDNIINILLDARKLFDKNGNE